uniref:Dynactin subunit 1 n=1 Tax=Cacopsylla melanoneura TaxID=428564 RepID=A0A8D8XG27_9HEMI
MSLQLGSRVEVTGKNVLGTVAYLGNTSFAVGKWVGIILDEPKGKNNGLVNGKQYFECDENCGLFVKQNQLTLIDESGNRIDLSSLETSTPASKLVTPKAGSRMSSSRQSLTSSTTSIKSNSSTKSREDVSSSTPNIPGSLPDGPRPGSLSKRSSFIEQPPSSTNDPLKTPRTSKLLTPKSYSMSTPTSALKTPTPVSKSGTKSKTGFVETLKPQFNPGQSLTASARPTPSTPVATPLLVDTIQNEEMKAELQDLKEKLETMKIKYREKTRDYDELKIQLDQSAEFKSKIMESQASLKRDIEKLKLEKQEAVEAKEETSDLAETLEMMTLDKEMAEERSETLQVELDLAKEKIEELTLDLELIKADIEKSCEGGGGGEGGDGANQYQMKQLEQQNLRLRETLVRLRDLSAHEKHEMAKLQKDLEEKKQENTELIKSQEKLKQRVAEMEADCADLHEQVDAALGAEEMVQQLTLRKLDLEDLVSKQAEEIVDLEALQVVSDQLQEDAREIELELKEEVEMARNTTREILREKDAALESLADRELTIVKFRELVQKLQDQCQDLQHQLHKEASNQAAIRTAIPDMLDYKKMFAETKAHARTIDLELRRLEVQQSQQHVQYLTAYMPDAFLSRGGDNDAVRVLLLIPSLLWKSEILLSQIKEKFPPVDSITHADLVRSHKAEQFVCRSKLSFHLFQLQAILRQYASSLNLCTPEVLLKAGQSYPEMAANDRTLDGFIEMLKTDQLDEKVPTENIEKCVTYFNSFYPVLFPDTKFSHVGHLLMDYVKILTTACDCLQTDSKIIQALIEQTTEEEGYMTLLTQHLTTVSEVMLQHLKQVRRRVASFSDIPDIGIADELLTSLAQSVLIANDLSKVMREVSKAGLSMLPLGDDKIDESKISEIAGKVCDSTFSPEALNQGVVSCIKNQVNELASNIANVAQNIQDIDPPLVAKPEEPKIPPIVVRAKQVKQEIEEIKNLKSKIEDRERDIKELKILIRSKQEEIGEISVRKDLAESKLANAIRDKDYQEQKLKGKIEDLQNLLKKKEKEYEDTMDHLQADIESLETEKGELKDKLKNMNKKVLFDNVVKTAAGKESGGPVHISINTSGKVQDSPLLVNEISWLRSELEREKREKQRLQTETLLQKFNKLAPITVVTKETTRDVDALRSKVEKLRMNYNEYLLKHPKVIPLNKTSDPEKLKQQLINNRVEQQLELDQLQDRFTRIQSEITAMKIQSVSGCQANSDFGVFPIPDMKKTLEKDQQSVVMGEVILPRVPGDTFTPDIVHLNLNFDSYNYLRKKLETLSYA